MRSLFLLILALPVAARAAIVTVDGANGTITDAQTWTAGNTYHVTFLNVAASGSLTIEAGTVVKFAAVTAAVDGTLTVAGSAASPVILTSDEDESVGDDIQPGTPTTPASGNWNGIDLRGSVSMNHFELRFAGNANSSFDAALHVAPGASVDLGNCVIRASDNEGILIEGASPTISACAFEDSLFGAAVRMDLASDPTLTGVTFTNNRTNGVEVAFGTAAGDVFLDDPGVVYSVAGMTVTAGNTLTIAPGQVIKAASSNTQIVIDGTLLAPGTSGAPIILTSPLDDAAGGDTNNDGNATTPVGGNWQGVRINGAATLSHVELAYAGNTNSSFDSTLHVDGGTVTADHCTIRDSVTAGLTTATAATLTVNSCAFQDNVRAAISTDVDSDVSVFGSSFSNNAINGWQVRGGTTSRNITWNSPETVVSIDGSITVAPGLSLMIDAGQVIKVDPNLSLFANGTVSLLGTAENPVVLTSHRDDTVGGDTNNDGPSLGAPGDWSALWADGGAVILNHVRARFGGTTNSSARSILNAVNMGDLQADNVVVEQSFTAGVACDQMSQIMASNLIVSRNGAEGIRASSGCAVELINATLSNNATALRATGAMIEAVNVNLTFSSSLAVSVSSGGDATLAFSNLFGTSAVSGIPDPIGSNGNISADPAYVDAAGGDFRLLASSGSLDSGTSDSAPTNDLLGAARFDNPAVPNTGAGAAPFVDIGAIERQDGLPGPLLALDEGDDVGDRLGSAVSVDGNRIAVGVPNADTAGVDDGRVFIYERNGNAFELVDIIDVPAGFFAVNFGSAVALQGDQILVGATGTSGPGARQPPQAKGGTATPLQAAIFERASGQWTVKVTLEPDDGTSADGFGASVSLDGDLAVVGAPGDSEGGIEGAGAAHVFRVAGSAVTQQLKIRPAAPAANGNFGTAVGASGSRIAVGEPGGSVGQAVSGSVTLYEQLAENLGSIEERDRVAPASSTAGDAFGQSLALAGSTLVVGAPMADAGAQDAGSAYVFDFTGSLTQTAVLAPASPGTGGHFGMAVGLDENGLIAGAPGVNAGRGAVFRFDESRRLLERIDGPREGQGFGMAVGLGDNALAVGAPDSNAEAGLAFSRVANELLLYADGFER